jgi:hypothetical protein
MLEAETPRPILRKNFAFYIREVRLFCWSRGSDWLRAAQRRGRSSSPSRVKNFLHFVQTGSEAHPSSYPMFTAGSFPGGKFAGACS